MPVLYNSAKTQYSGIVWAENSENSVSRYRKYSREKERVEIEFFFIFGNVRQFISNSNSSKTKYFYDWPISNSSNTPIRNYFLTVRTKDEFTVLTCSGKLVHIFLPVTDNCSSWLSGRGRMAVEMFSWQNLHERMCQTWGSNSGPLACQANSLLIELPRPNLAWRSPFAFLVAILWKSCISGISDFFFCCRCGYIMHVQCMKIAEFNLVQKIIKVSWM